MLTIILALFVFWATAGGVFGLSFHYDQVLPHSNRFKNICGLIVCGPLWWIGRAGIYTYKALATWLEE